MSSSAPTPPASAGLTYESTGVDYTPLDAFKRACQRSAAATVGALAAHGLTEPANIRGESAYLLEAPDRFLAHVEEGLGTKNMIADAMLQLTGVSYYKNVAIDTVATIVNDLVTVGALPISVAMHAAVGDSAWFNERQRAADLAAGFADGCRLAGAVWGGGETPALKGMVNPDTIILAGSAFGQVYPKSNRITGDVKSGDAIVFLASTGVHTNGLTLCRALADRLPEGYLTKIADGRSYGEALLDPSHIYVPFVAACQREGVPLHYAAHVTGHGWRKLMRLQEPFVYRITELRPHPPVFDFLAQSGPIDLREMYATFNMGVGFAVYVDPKHADACLRLAKACNIPAWVAGEVRTERGQQGGQGGRKAVEIPPLGITFDSDTLHLR
jgi:phosphoribosylformylglycinamidine cyclo-ligase